MSSLFVKRLSSFSPSSFFHRHLALLTPLLRLSFSFQPPEQQEIPFMAKYLISSFGFSPDRALRCSTDKHLIASQPVLIGYSLVNRLVPRHQVLSILAAKGLGKGYSILTASRDTEERFLERYVEPYKKDVPELAGAYFAYFDRNVHV